MSGLFTLVSAGRSLEKQLDTTANNLANVDSVGYKEDQLAFREMLSQAQRVPPESGQEQFLTHEYLDMYVGMDKSTVAVDESGKNFSMGPMRTTDNPLDLALTSDGFFTISTPQGDRFTRAGSFTIAPDKTLVTKEGFAVLGEQGPIQVNGNKVDIDDDGGVFVDGALVDRLNLVKFRDKAGLQKLGNSFYAPVDLDNPPIRSREVQVKQGMLEQSNVNSVKEMVRMIQANRSYETVQKAMRRSDGLNEKAISLVKS